MAYDEDLAQRLIDATIHLPDVTTRKMFGGFAVMSRGNMVAGVIGDELMVRVGPDQHNAAVARPGAVQMVFGGRSMRGMVTVAAEHQADDESLADWVALAEAFVSTLPPK